MRVICAYTNLHPATAEALAKYAPDAELFETPGTFDYNHVIESVWDSGDDLVVIEQDKIITAEVISSFAACNHDWCVYSYDTFPPPYTMEVSIGLGCTKFSARVQHDIPVSEFLYGDDPAWPTCPNCNGVGCWRYLDSRIDKCLWERNVPTYVHGRVEHMHSYPDPENWTENYAFCAAGTVTVAGEFRNVTRG